MSKWGGQESLKARDLVRALGFPQPCTKCGQPVQEHENWHADHYAISRHQAKLAGLKISELPVAAAHARCNMADGGRVGARIVNARRNERTNSQTTTSKRKESTKLRNIRGVA